MITPKELFEWCKIPVSQLENNPGLRLRLRLVKDSQEMGQLMASELAGEIQNNNILGKSTRAIIPCGPACWYKPFTDLVNEKKISLKNMEVFHMDECLDWQGKELPRNHPYSFRGFMEKHFYGPVDFELTVPEINRIWLNASNITYVSNRIQESPVDITFGGWGQDGHIAYNQARRHPFSQIDLNELRNSTIRIQENNIDTIIALAHRTFGSAYQFVPPMSVTLGIKECFSAKKLRLFSDTGAWKQTALRVALFSPPVTDYPLTLCQEHPDAILTATIATASHPVSEHPDWDLGL